MTLYFSQCPPLLDEGNDQMSFLNGLVNERTKILTS